MRTEQVIEEWMSHDGPMLVDFKVVRSLDARTLVQVEGAVSAIHLPHLNRVTDCRADDLNTARVFATLCRHLIRQWAATNLHRCKVPDICLPMVAPGKALRVLPHTVALLSAYQALDEMILLPDRDAVLGTEEAVCFRA